MTVGGAGGFHRTNFRIQWVMQFLKVLKIPSIQYIRNIAIFALFLNTDIYDNRFDYVIIACTSTYRMMEERSEEECLHEDYQLCTTKMIQISYGIKLKQS